MIDQQVQNEIGEEIITISYCFPDTKYLRNENFARCARNNKKTDKTKRDFLICRSSDRKNILEAKFRDTNHWRQIFEQLTQFDTARREAEKYRELKKTMVSSAFFGIRNIHAYLQPIPFIDYLFTF